MTRLLISDTEQYFKLVSVRAMMLAYEQANTNYEARDSGSGVRPHVTS